MTIEMFFYFVLFVFVEVEVKKGVKTGSEMQIIIA